jgi:hypothetical protein
MRIRAKIWAESYPTAKPSTGKRERWWYSYIILEKMPPKARAVGLGFVLPPMRRLKLPVVVITALRPSPK